MNWITNYVRPKINSMLGRRTDMPENLWIKDPETGEMIFHKDLESNQFVIPGSGHHMKISAKERLKYFFDEGKYETLENPKVALDPLKFRDEKRYTDRLKEAKAKTGLEDAILNAAGTIEGLPVVAEGVESGHHLTLIRLAGCDWGQGYHIGRPVPAEELRAAVMSR